MTTKAAFYKGVRLFQNLQGWEPTPSSESARRTGVLRSLGEIVAESPNHFIDLSVLCAVRPVTASSPMDRQTTFNVLMDQVLDRLISVNAALGPVAWCQDDTQYGTVSGSHSAGSSVAVAHGALGGSWVTAANRYVLFRNPDTGAGFVAIIQSRTSGSVTCDLEEAITSSWEIWNVQLHYPSMRFVTMSRGTPNVPSGDYHRTGPQVEYQFEGKGRVVVATALQQDIG